MKSKLFTQENERMLMIISCILAVLIPLLIFVLAKCIDFGINILVKPKQYANHNFIYTYDGYMHLQTEKRMISADKPIEFTIHTAFVDAADSAKFVEYISVIAAHSDYWEVEVTGASEKNVRDSYLYFDVPPYNDVTAQYIISEFNSEELAYRPGVFGRITKESLPYTINVTVKLSEEAPREFTDEIWFVTEVSGSKELADNSTNCRVCVKIERKDDKIRLKTYTDIPLA